MAETKKEANLRKRNQIAKSNQMMFVWVASASVIIGFALVISIFLARQIIFNEKVLAEKDKTVATLRKNIANIPELEAQIRVLDSNSALMSVKAKESDRTVQVILDALPSGANSPALGASLQKKLLAGVEGITLETLDVTPVAGVETALTEGTISDTSSSDISGQILFTFSIKGTNAGFKAAMQNLERSIRAIDILSATFESQNNENVLTIQARAFYEPEHVVELKNKVVTW